MASRTKTSDPSPRFGIGEWFGFQLDKLTPETRLEFANSITGVARACPFRTDGKNMCTKKGGVCSFRLYEPLPDDASELPECRPVSGIKGSLRIACPLRFQEDNMVFSWAGETILGNDKPMKATEVGFLLSTGTLDASVGNDVGKIDQILAVTNKNIDLEWCAMEMQAVYFSGNAMSTDYRGLRETNGALLLPAGKRRMDYRSSGPKRLMPQLQIKVPTLRRWGKRMAVVVDRAFFDSMGRMDTVDDLSNCDIAWFVVGLDTDQPGVHAKLIRDEVILTTLERAVEGLTAGAPVTVEEFERRLMEKLNIS